MHEIKFETYTKHSWVAEEEQKKSDTVTLWENCTLGSIVYLEDH